MLGLTLSRSVASSRRVVQRVIGTSLLKPGFRYGGLVWNYGVPSDHQRPQISKLAALSTMASQNGDEPMTRHGRHGSVDYHDVSLPKKLIVCCDGTWMDSDNGYVSGGLFSKGHVQNPTNVTRIARAMAAEDDGHHPQVVYYQAGVGTGLGITSQLVGGGTGLGLTENIREAYAFLANNYRVNDPDKLVAPDAIFLLGFSRGAFTARSIAGLLGGIGLLKKKAMSLFYEAVSDWFNAGSHDYTPLFFDSYFKRHKDVAKVKPADSLARDQTKVREYLTEYRRILLSLDLTQEVEIKCIGVWDTVGALGVPVNPVLQKVFPFLPTFVHEYSWFDTSLDNHIKNAFQALALDEHRYPFSPTLWEKPATCNTNLKQVWFPGAHSNIGGSYADQGMADITLAWMMDQLAGHTSEHPHGFTHHNWIKFDDSFIDTWYDNDLRYLSETKVEDYRGWGMGCVYQSNTFPQSLAGARVRSPGRYHRKNYDTGKPDPDVMLRETHEMMHACVRIRVQKNGRGVESAPSAGLGFFQRALGDAESLYRPTKANEPLNGWRLVETKAAGVPMAAMGSTSSSLQPQSPSVVWKFEGSDKCDLPNREMKEDRLGPFEIQLLKKDKPLAAQMLITEEGWHWLKADEQVLDQENPRSTTRVQTMPL